MAAIKESIDIARPPEEVFAYLTDPSHITEWQESAVAARPLDDAPLHVGSRVAVTRRFRGRDMPMVSEVTEFDPPRSWRMHGIDGPVRGDVRATVEPMGGGTRSLVTLTLDFEAHGMGHVLVPLVVRPSARKEMPRNEQKLKELLEHSG
ncbi:hypothetical protein GCM10010441_25830 [Kitasatospora paracochleata]|uniref:Uncharacterized protein YndB with AHSA1/START domain n=1 Tax=Kitasatospora paracochleata TaxID=58354 RepID=A0ABT1J131_9ACTN|nr:SRPBCC family protein [Kitasatospora paracochleata]MCP2311140.1 uncharacterized protein YndB with AHSA1/START domain [Kitasatospora paracochleata]